MAVKRPTQSEKLNRWLLNKKKTLHICALYQIASSEEFEWPFKGSFIVSLSSSNSLRLAKRRQHLRTPLYGNKFKRKGYVTLSTLRRISAVKEKAASKAVMWPMWSGHGIISSLWLMHQLVVPHVRVWGPWQSLACCLGYLYKCCD